MRVYACVCVCGRECLIESNVLPPSVPLRPPPLLMVGQQLDNFTGCAAILRFPLADPDEEEQDREEEDEEVEYSRGENGRRSRSGSTFFGADD